MFFIKRKVTIYNSPFSNLILETSGIKNKIRQYKSNKHFLSFPFFYNSPFLIFVLKNLSAIYFDYLISIGVKNCSLSNIGMKNHIIICRYAGRLCSKGIFDFHMRIVVIVDNTKIHFYFPFLSI